MKLPSQKLFIFAVPALILLGVLNVAWKNVSKKVDAQQQIQVVTIHNTFVDEIDTDRDGLKDWEESIWKTDIHNPNTYGMSDTDYVKLQIEQGEKTESLGGPIETTEELSQRLFTEYTLLRQSGPVSSSDIALLTQRLMEEMDVSESSNPYTANTLVVFSDSDKQGIENYAAKLSEIRERFSRAYAQATGDTLSVDNAFVLDNMVFASEIYLNFAQELMNIPVPNGAVSFHLDYANSLRESSLGLQAIGENKDPLVSLAGMQRHSEAQNLQQQSITSLTLFLNQSGIISSVLQLF